MAAIVIWILFLEYLSHCPSLCRQVPMLVNQNKNLYEFIILEFFFKTDISFGRCVIGHFQTQSMKSHWLELEG